MNSTLQKPIRSSWRPAEAPPEILGVPVRDFQTAAKSIGGVYNLNGFFTTPSYLQDAALTKFFECFAPLRSFNTVFDPSPYTKNAKNILKYVESGSTTLVDGTNFQVGGSTIGAIECSVSHYSQPWPVSTKDLQSGIREADLFSANAQALADTLTSKWTALLTATNFPNPPVASALFGLDSSAKAYGEIKGNDKSLILNSPQFAMLSHSSPKAFASGESAYNWRGIYDSSSGWAAADPKVVGVALAKPAIVMVTGFLEEIRAGSIMRKMIQIPGLDLAVDWYRWHDQATRTTWNSLDCIFGVAPADGAAAVLIKTP